MQWPEEKGHYNVKKNQNALSEYFQNPIEIS